MIKSYNIKYAALLCLSLLVLAGCSNEKTVRDNQGVNKWIHETLQKEYLWSHTMSNYVPSDLSPKSYLEKVRYRVDRSVPVLQDYFGDRFSSVDPASRAGFSEGGHVSFASDDYITNDFGFGYYYVVDDDDDVVYCQTMYVIPGSPAEAAGIKRGYNFNAVQVGSRVYNMPMSIADLKSAMSNKTVKLHTFYPEENEIEVTKGAFYNVPVLFDSVYDTSGGKTAYLVYNRFSSGASDMFNDELKSVFAKFKEKGARNLILDLRYNGGGELNVALLLGSMIARAGDLGKPFVYLERNTHNGMGYNNYDVRKFHTSASLGPQYNLDVDKLYIITLNYTASASELILHCLKPYFGSSLLQVGEQTFGKNVGSIRITNSRYEWQISPITMRVYDKEGVSGYERGIVPGEGSVMDGDKYVSGNGETSPAIYNVLGDFGELDGVPENMLGKVMDFIDGGGGGARSAVTGSEGIIDADIPPSGVYRKRFPGAQIPELIEDERTVY